MEPKYFNRLSECLDAKHQAIRDAFDSEHYHDAATLCERLRMWLSAVDDYAAILERVDRAERDLVK